MRVLELAPKVGFAPDPAIVGSGVVLPDLAEAAATRFLGHNGWIVEASQPAQFLYQPGSSVIVRRTVWAARDGQERRFSVAVAAGRRPAVAAAAPDGDRFLPQPLLESDDGTLSWAFPHDPWLLDLGKGLTVAGARSVAESMLGYEVNVHAGVLRYRPGKRAVMRYRVRRRRSREPWQDIFVKALRPSARSRAMQAASVLNHANRLRALPQPTELGLLAYRAVPGRSLREILLQGNERLPNPAVFRNVIAELASLPDPGTPGPASPKQRLRSARRLLRTTVPHLAGRVDALSEQLLGQLNRHEVEETIVHGDLYEGQILVGDEGTGLLDLDDLGRGDPAMDAANTTAHLAALAESHPAQAGRIGRYLERVRADLLAGLDVSDAALRTREAVAMLQLATGPIRVLADEWPHRVEQRLAMAEQVLAR